MLQLDLRNIPCVETKPLGDKFYGTDGQGHTIGFTNQSMLVDGKPTFGVSGEMHFSRVSPDQWEDSIRKALAGGVKILASYVFWNVHEEVEGTFRFDGCRDLRAFVSQCQQQGMQVILRVGPFAHGEMRNGGLPDWLYGKPFEVRNNNAAYLAYVRRFYQAVSDQVQGLFFQQGGPIIAVQLENEYMHSSAPWEITTGIANEWVNGGQDGEDHIRKLKKLALETGLVAPFYTCTAWGGGMAPTDEVLPLWGGYAYRPWIFYSRRGEHPCTEEYIYRNNHSNAVPETYNFEPRYLPEDMPYACCEMMGGMMCSYNYRFTLPFESIDALANIKLGSGCAMLGYYMYRGGTTPKGERAEFLNESQICKLSYDYQAPLGEYGQRRPSYYRLRTLHAFCHSFSEQLLGSVTVLPDNADSMQPEDTDTLRWCVREKDGRGFLFLNNFQDHLALPARENEQIALQLPNETVTFPPISLASGENAVLPFNLAMGSLLLQSATVQPITCLELEGERCWFFMIPEGMTPVMRFAAGEAKEIPLPTDRISSFLLEGERIVVLPRREAMRFGHYTQGNREVAYLADSGILWNGEKAFMETQDAPQTLQVWHNGGFMDSNTFVPASATVALETTKVGASRWTVQIPVEKLTGHKQVLLRVSYLGNIGQAFIDGSMVHDNFCNGQPWEMRVDNLAEQLASHPLTFYIVPIKEGASVTVDTTMAARMENVQQTTSALEKVELVFVDEVEVG